MCVTDSSRVTLAVTTVEGASNTLSTVAREVLHTPLTPVQPSCFNTLAAVDGLFRVSAVSSCACTRFPCSCSGLCVDAQPLCGMPSDEGAGTAEL